jgi:hypothetical protein
MRFRDIEFRWSTYNKKHELVKWYKVKSASSPVAGADTCEERNYCYVVALFDKTNEGYSMRTIGDRFFEDKDAFVVGKYAIEFLNETFEIERQEEELK